MYEPSPDQIREWSHRYKTGTLNEQERKIFEEWLLSSPAAETEWSGAEDRETLRKEMYTQIRHETHPVRRLWLRNVAAAAIVLITAGVIYYLANNEKPQKEILAQQQTSDAMPGKQGAVLTLADGRKIVLDSLEQGTIASEHGNAIILGEGQLSYANKQDPNTPEIYNTLSTPKGRVYQLVLADGTKVWLNSASSITYPLSFTNNKRTVTISGEAYFEVAKEKNKPFDVHAGSAIIQVLGTHFNVNSYDDEAAIKTTLLEGSVRVKQHNYSTLLKPGQQAQNDQQGKITPAIIKADTEEVMAWKDGLFQFNDASLQMVMRQLSRWYDVEVKYEGKIPDKKLVGEINKDSKLSEVLKALQYTGIHFRIEGKTMIVTQ